MQQIGRYQVKEELGRGAMGIVYRALDPSIGRTVAIKTIRLSDVSDAGERDRLHERLFREAQSAGMLSHPNIVTIYDIAEEGEVTYIAMEVVEGPTLEAMLRFQPPDAALILSILRQIASALDYAHKRGVIHRDIKPANVMLHEGSAVKITDFGIAKIQSAQLTQTATISGTPNYMSPEQIQGHAVDGRTDQFSLAVIAYELLTGARPFAGDTMPTVLFKIVREEPLAPQRLNPSLGWAVETVLKRALSKDAAERYKSCSDFVQALENACASSKGWKPLAPGAASDLPTVMAAGAAVKPATAEGSTAGRMAPVAPAAVEEDVPVPKPLKVARMLAAIIVAAALLCGAIILGIQYFGDHETEPLVASQPVPTPEKEAPRPSPTEQVPLPPLKAPEPEKAQEESPKPVPAKNTAKEIPPGEEKTARLVTNPPGATLVVDSKPELTCQSPCTLPLGPGRHTLSAELSGYRRSLRIFELPNETVVFVNLDKTTGTVMIRSEPVGATIALNGQLRAEKTPASLTLPVGTYRVEISKEGFQTYVEQLEVKDGVLTNIDVNWPGRSR